MKRIPVLSAAVLLGTVAAPPVHAAAAGVPAYCHIDIVLEAPDGLSLETGSATYTSSGSAVCFGEPDGIRATGPGTYTSYGTIGGSCAGASGDFHYRITLPTAQGEATIVDGGDFTSPTFTAGKGSGAFEFVPIDGDCVTEPLTKMRVIAQLIFTG